MPWETGSTDGKYKYYPGGDKSREAKDAPSAVNVVVVPNVNLPKVRMLPIQDTKRRRTAPELAGPGLEHSEISFPELTCVR